MSFFTLFVLVSIHEIYLYIPISILHIDHFFIELLFLLFFFFLKHRHYRFSKSSNKNEKNQSSTVDGNNSEPLELSSLRAAVNAIRSPSASSCHFMKNCHSINRHTAER